MAESVDLNTADSWLNKKNIVKLAPLILISILFAIIFMPFFGAVILAAIFALALNPYVKKIRLKSPILSQHAHTWVFASFLVLLILPFIFFSIKFYSYFTEIKEGGVETTISQLGSVEKVTEKFVTPFLNKLQIEPTQSLKVFIQKEMSDGLAYVLNTLQNLLSEIPQTLFLFFIFLISLYYFMSEALPIRRWFMQSHLYNHKKSNKYVQILLSSSNSAVLTNVVVGVIQGSIVAFGALLLNVGDFALIWMITFFLSFIPLFGTAPITLFLAFLMFAKGLNAEGAGMLVVGLVTGTIDNILRSYMMTSQKEPSIHPIIALIGLFGAIEIMGFSGLFIGPMIMSVTAKLFAEYFEEKQNKVLHRQEAELHNYVHQMECLTNTKSDPKQL